MDFRIFLLVPFPVETVPLEWALVGISLVVPLTVRAFERVRAGFVLLCLEARWV